MNIGIYGPLVIGEQRFQEEQRVVRTASNIYGPMVVGRSAAVQAPAQDTENEAKAPKNAESLAAAAGADASLSLNELRAALAANPALLDGFIDAEFQRPGGPRKGALREFLTVEQEREGGPRKDVLDVIQSALSAA